MRVALKGMFLFLVLMIVIGTGFVYIHPFLFFFATLAPVLCFLNKFIQLLLPRAPRMAVLRLSSSQEHP